MLLEILEDRCTPATLIVTTAIDSDDGGDGVLSLREAIQSAASGDTIEFSASLAGATIHLQSQLTIDKDLTIDGESIRAAGGIRISGDSDSNGVGDTRLFEVNGTGTDLTLSYLTMIDGRTSGSGGALEVYDATVNLLYSSISDSKASYGGAIYVSSGTLLVSASTLDGNEGDFGGAIFAESSAVTIVNATIAENRANYGGGIALQFGTLAITNATIVYNNANGAGGGLYNNGSTTISNSLVAGNTYSSTGNSDIEGSDVNTVSLSPMPGYNIIGDPDTAGGLSNNSNGNQVGQDDPDNPGSRELLDLSTVISTILGDNGGPTDTYALLPGSIAIGTGNVSLLVAGQVDDQRGPGFAREIGGSVDVGAFEFNPSDTVALSSIETDDPSPTNASSVTFVVTFDRDVQGVAAGNFSINAGGTATGSVTSVTSRNNSSVDSVWVVTVDSVSGNGTLGILVDPTGITSLGGIPLSSGTPSGADEEYTIDTVPPTVTLSSSVAAYTNQSFSVTMSIMDGSNPLAGVPSSALTLTNAVIDSFTDHGDGTYTIVVQPQSIGAVNVSVAAGAFQDAAGNDNTASNTISTYFDTTSPAVALTTAVSSPTNQTSVVVTVTVTDNLGPITGLTSSILTLNNATVANFVGNGDGTYTVTVEPQSVGTFTIEVATGAFQDAAGNDNTASNQLELFFDNVAPTIALTTAVSSPTNQTSIAVTMTITDDLEIATLSGSVLSLSNATVSDFVYVGSNVYTFTLHPSGTGQYTFSVAIAAGEFHDPAGNDNAASNTLSLDFSDTAPAVALSTLSPSPTNQTSLDVTMAVSDPLGAITGLTSSVLTVTNATIAGFVDHSDGTYTITVEPQSVGTFTIEVAAGAFQDAAGNDNTASNQLELFFDNIAPTIALTTAVSSPTNQTSIAVTMTITDALEIATLSDSILSLSNATVSDFAYAGSNVYTFTLHPSGTGQYTVSVAIAAGEFQDAAGNDNDASNTLSLDFSDTAPAVALSTLIPSPTNHTTIEMTMTVTDPLGAVTGLTSSVVTVTNATIVDFVDHNNGTYTVRVSPQTVGTFTVEVAAGAFQDAAGNGNTASNPLELFFDNVAPTVVLSTATSSPTNQSSIAVTMTITDALEIATLSGSIFSLSNATVSDFAYAGSNVYTFTLNPNGVGHYTILVAVADGVFQDPAGNDNAASNTLSIVFSDSAPTVSLSTLSPSPTNQSAIEVTMEVTDPLGAVTGLTSSVVTVTNATIAGFVDHSDGTYTITVAPQSVGIVSIDVAAGAFQDAAGNDNIASNQIDLIFDNVGPVVTLSPVTPSPTNSTAIEAILSFSTDYATVGPLTQDVVTVGNGMISSFVDNGDGTYTVVVMPNQPGNVTMQVLAGAFIDSLGNPNSASNVASFAFSNDGPAISISQMTPVTTMSFDVLIDVTDWVGPISTMTSSMITVEHGLVTAFAYDGNGNYIASIRAASAGTVRVFVLAGAFDDPVGNANQASNVLTVVVPNTPVTPVGPVIPISGPIDGSLPLIRSLLDGSQAVANTRLQQIEAAFSTAIVDQTRQQDGREEASDERASRRARYFTDETKIDLTMEVLVDNFLDGSTLQNLFPKVVNAARRAVPELRSTELRQLWNSIRERLQAPRDKGSDRLDGSNNSRGSIDSPPQIRREEIPTAQSPSLSQQQRDAYFEALT